MAEAMVSMIIEKLNLSISEKNVFDGKSKVAFVMRNDASTLCRLLERHLQIIPYAERGQMKEETLKVGLDELKDVSYDIEDMLDEWKMLKQIIKEDYENAHRVYSHHKKINKLMVCFPSPSFDFDSYHVLVSGRAIAYKTLVLMERLDDFNSRSRLWFDNPTFWFENLLRLPLYHNSTANFLLDPCMIHGRDNEKDSLISKLLSESISTEEGKGLQIISIVGMGGIGKTSLTRLVYNDDRVTSYFDKKLWVRVFRDFDVLRIAKSIIESLQVTDFSSNNDLNSCLVHISQSIVEKRIFLVLDDVSLENYSSWDMILQCLKNGLHGSKILITTQKESVARMIQSTVIITLKALSEEECWLLFGRIAFLDRSLEECEELEEIGRKIVSKCEGLPLAIKTVGNVLRFRRRKEEWQWILESEMWELEEFERRTFYPLWLSYINLPSSMVRQCFLYCAIFPKEHRIIKDELIKLWMAQGYLENEKNIEMEAIGEEYFELLAAQFLFQEFDRDDYGNIITCKMPDIVHDFLQFLAENECRMLEVYGDLGQEPGMYSYKRKLRHLMLKLYRGVPFPESMLKEKQLRSLLIQYGVTNCSSICEFLPKLLNELTSLRALNLRGQLWFENVIIAIPKEIGKLIHLKYLNLSSLKIDELPEELCKLYNLQTLELSWCTNLTKLPQGMGKLINLRHLVNDGTSLNDMPKGIERLTCLRTLSEFVVGCGGEACTLACLKNLNYLQGSLRITKLGATKNVRVVKEAKLNDKENLIRLHLNFENDAEEVRMNEDEEKMKHEMILLEALQPPPNLELLEIRGYKGDTFPDWIMSLSKLKTLNFQNCTNIKHLPPLGKLPSLESLSICSMWSVKSVGNEFWGIRSDGASSSSSSSVVSFPELKSLKFVNMEEWEDWDWGNAIMPSLHFLSFVHCPKLKALPHQILQTEMLQELNINWCPVLKKRYSGQTGEGWRIISRIPNIMINFEYVQGDGE